MEYFVGEAHALVVAEPAADEDPADAVPDGPSDAPDAVDAANPLHIA